MIARGACWRSRWRAGLRKWEPPLFLALQEWTYSSTTYTGPTLCRFMAKRVIQPRFYRHPENSNVDWVAIFPCHVVASVPGIHGELSWQDKSVAELAKHLTSERERLAPNRTRCLRTEGNAQRRILDLLLGTKRRF